jgi:hypothetical protein
LKDRPTKPLDTRPQMPYNMGVIDETTP